MSLGSTQPVTDFSTRNVSWGSKGDRCVGLTTLPPSCADCLEILEPQTNATIRVTNTPVQGLLHFTSRDILNPTMKKMNENLSGEIRVVPCGRTDMTKLIHNFRNHLANSI